MTAKFDRRVTPYRDDLAAVWLKGQVKAARFAEPLEMCVSAPSLGMRSQPKIEKPFTTEALMGEAVRVFETRDGWAWGQLVDDGYVGYLPLNGLAPAGDEPTHVVVVPCSTLYPEPNIKTQPIRSISLGVKLRAVKTIDAFIGCDDGGFVHAQHVQPLGMTASDFVAFAEKFVGAPYVWGGKQWTGIDCSGLVQEALKAAGIACPRDSDMQEASLGQSLPQSDWAELRRGDLVFWPGHVGIMVDSEMLLHATGHYMQVVIEPLATAAERIRGLGAMVRSIRRL